MASPELYSTQLEYQGNRVPLSKPQLFGVQVEYIPLPPPVEKSFTASVKLDAQKSGFIQDNVAVNTLSKATVQNTVISYKIVASELLAYTEVSSNSSFSTESKWRYLVAQYRHSSGQLKNIIVRKPSSEWVGTVLFTSDAPTGTWVKRSIIIRANDGAELILLPTRFTSPENLILNA